MKSSDILLLLCLSLSTGASQLVDSTSSLTTSTRTSSSLEPEITLLPNNKGLVSVPISINTADLYYNAYLTDVSGNIVGGRVDYLQPNVWLLNGESLLDCLVVASYASAFTKSQTTSEMPLSLSYSGTTWDLNQCHSNGAIYPNTVITTTVSMQNATITSLLYTTLLTGSLRYGTTVYAKGDFVTGNLTFETTNDTIVSLTDFDFVIANWSNRLTGGFGLGPTNISAGIIPYFLGKNMLQGNGYSVFYSPRQNGTNGEGVLILGGVDLSYFSGTLYAFPAVPHSISSNMYYPIVVLEQILLKNEGTGLSSNIYNDTPIAVLLDSRLRFSYLPMSIILSLAVQTSAVYSNQKGRWIVRCSDIWGVDATINFKIGPLWLNIPLESFIVPASPLSYSNGDTACYLTVLPMSWAGYTAFGLNVLTHVYMAMDNTNGTVALANYNENVTISNTIAVMTGSSAMTNKTTVGIITSGSIPFASSVTIQPNVTLTFSKGNLSSELNLPARFSGSIFFSDSLISDNFQMSSVSTGSMSNSRSLSNGLKILNFGPDYTVLAGYAVLVAAGFIGIVLV